ncbi:MAG: ABC transporter permease [Lachnotalea sp.]
MENKNKAINLKSSSNRHGLKSFWNNNWYSIIRISAAIGLAFIIAAIIIVVSAGENSQEAIYKFFVGPFLSGKRTFFNIIEAMIPLVFAGLAINIMHKSGLFSLAADSSFYFSGVTAAVIAIQFQMPNIVHQFVIILAGGLVGALIGLLPVVIKKYTGASELVVSLMMGYIFYNGGYWIIRNFYLDSSNGSYSVNFAKTATLGTMFKGTSTHWGLVIMFGVVIVASILINKTRYGRALEITGKNKKFSKYAGLNVSGIIISSQIIGGAFAGIGGSVEMIGRYTKFSWTEPLSYVWDGILINLLAGQNPAFIPVAAFFISYIRIGARLMSRAGFVDEDILSVIQAIIILLIASERFLYQLKKRKEEKEALENQITEKVEIA